GIKLLLEPALFIGRGAFLRDEKSANDATVASRQQGEWQLLEEEPDAKDAGDHHRQGNPAVPEKPIKRTPVSVADGIEDALDDALRPGLAMLWSALDENARTHQRRQGERDQTRRKDCND